MACQVAAQLLTANEKDEVAQLVDTMLGFGISYKHPKPGLIKAEYGMEGQSVLALSPPIDTLVKYKVNPSLCSICNRIIERFFFFLCLLG